jgi:type VI secretion system protein ImpC
MDPDFADLLERDALLAVPAAAEDVPPPAAWLATLARLFGTHSDESPATPRRLIEALIAGIDISLSAQLNAILHAPEYQALEATWRGLWMLVGAADTDAGVKVKVLNVGKHDMAGNLRKFRGNAWDQSPIFKRIYEDEYGQFGGEPYGLLIGDYTFDHRPGDVAMLRDLAKIAAAAHAPFIAAAAPSLLQLDSWAEVANPRDLSRIFLTPDYGAWRALREEEDTRYLGLCMPRFLLRLPYGAATDPRRKPKGRTSTGCCGETRLMPSAPTWRGRLRLMAGACESAASIVAAWWKACRCCTTPPPTATWTGVRSRKSA